MISTGSRLPAATFASVPTGEAADIRNGRGPIVLATLHSPACDDCHSYCRRLVAERDGFVDWGARLVLLAPGQVPDAMSLATDAADAATVLADPARVLAKGAAAVIVADEWGEVYFAAEAGEGHEWPDPAEIADWVRFIAIQCPECEGPEGPWKTL